MAMADGIESANVVGYNSVTINKAWTIVGINFCNVGDAGAMSLQDAIPYVSGMTKGAADTSADSIQIQNESGTYDTYFMCNGKAGKTAVTDGDGKWVKSGEFAVTDRTVSSGTAFWYGSKNYTSPYILTVAGQVLNTATADSPISLAVKQIANPYASDLALNTGIPYTEGMTKGAADTSADNIQIQNDSGTYDTYFMCNGKAGKTAVTDGDGKWVKSGEFAVTTDSLPVGKGAWYLRRGSPSFSITITKPYSL